MKKNNNKNNNKNKADNKNKEVILSIISIGNAIDEKGLLYHTPSDRYLESQGSNPYLIRAKTKMFITEILTYILLSFSLITLLASLTKGKPLHYIQPPNGIVEKIEVKK